MGECCAKVFRRNTLLTGFFLFECLSNFMALEFDLAINIVAHMLKPLAALSQAIFLVPARHCRNIYIIEFGYFMKTGSRVVERKSRGDFHFHRELDFLICLLFGTNTKLGTKEV